MIWRIIIDIILVAAVAIVAYKWGHADGWVKGFNEGCIWKEDNPDQKAMR